MKLSGVMSFVQFLVIFMALSSACYIEDHWQAYKREHTKLYKDAAEEAFRFFVYMENFVMVEAENKKYETGEITYRLKTNYYSDRLPEEVSSSAFGLTKDDIPLATTELLPIPSDLPKTVDWRLQGAVTPVKDQGACSSSWAFSTVGAMEGMLSRQNGALRNLSEQQLIDCSVFYGNGGCQGGTFDRAFRYLVQSGGEVLESCYPYQRETNDACMDNSCELVNGTAIKGYVATTPGDEEVLKRAVAQQGPVAVGIDASSAPFLHYGGGIFTGESCKPGKLNHAMLVVGYGTHRGQDFWLLKNSWGEKWGEKGYMRLARNRGNRCGVASRAAYPIPEVCQDESGC